jgi:hypothetical protein
MTPSERLWEFGFLGFAGPTSREMDHFIMDEGVGEKASGRFEIVRARSFTRADAGFIFFYSAARTGRPDLLGRPRPHRASLGGQPGAAAVPTCVWPVRSFLASAIFLGSCWLPS